MPAENLRETCIPNAIQDISDLKPLSDYDGLILGTDLSFSRQFRVLLPGFLPQWSLNLAYVMTSIFRVREPDSPVITSLDCAAPRPELWEWLIHVAAWKGEVSMG